MSDTYRPDNENTNPSAEEQLSAATAQSVPHAGMLPEGQGQDLPVREFKDTPLHYADAEGFLAPLPDDAGALTETTPQRENGRRWLKPVAAIALAGSAFAGGLLVSGGSDGSEQRANTETPTTEDAPVATVPETTPTTEAEETPEVVGTNYSREPILLTATDAEGLLEQFESNISCMFGDNPIEVQQRCLEYLTAGGSGDLSSLYQERMAAVNDYRYDHPDYFPEVTRELLDSRIDPDREAILVVRMTGEDGSSIKRYTFVRTYASVGTLGVEDEDVQIWKLHAEHTLEEGEAHF